MSNVLNIDKFIDFLEKNNYKTIIISNNISPHSIYTKDREAEQIINNKNKDKISILESKSDIMMMIRFL